MAFNELYYHFVFVTKSRQHTIPPLHDGILHAYMGGVMKNLKCQPLKINGTDNHVHILIKAPTDLAPIPHVAASPRLRGNVGLPNLSTAPRCGPAAHM